MSNKKLTELAAAFLHLRSVKEVENFLWDLLTPTEFAEFATRFQIAKLLWTTDLSYVQIAARLNTSTTTVTRVARFLHKEPHHGYATVLKKLYPHGT